MTAASADAGEPRARDAAPAVASFSPGDAA